MKKNIPKLLTKKFNAMYSVKHLVGKENIETVKANTITKTRIKDPVLNKPISFLYINNKGLYEWSNKSNFYNSTTANKALSITDLFNINWELSY